MAFSKFGSSLFQALLDTFCGWSNAIVADQLVEKVRIWDITTDWLEIFPNRHSLIARLFSQEYLPPFPTVSHRCRRLQVDRAIWLASLFGHHSIWSQVFKILTSGHEDTHLLGCLQEHTNPEELIGTTAYLLVLHWWLPFPHLHRMWISNEGVARKKELQREIKSRAG